MDGWMEGRKEGKAGLRIAYSNQKIFFMTPFIYKTVQTSLSEIRTRTLCPEHPKSEQSVTEQEFVRISALFGYRTFVLYYTVIVRKPNVRYSDSAEIRTSSCSVTLCSDFGCSGPNVRVRISDTISQVVLAENGHKKNSFIYKTTQFNSLSEIRTFEHLFVWISNRPLNQTVLYIKIFFL